MVGRQFQPFIFNFPKAKKWAPRKFVLEKYEPLHWTHDKSKTSVKRSTFLFIFGLKKLRRKKNKQIVINGIFITFAYQFTRDVFSSLHSFYLRSSYIRANAVCPFIIIITIAFIIAIYNDVHNDSNLNVYPTNAQNASIIFFFHFNL